MSFRKEKKYRMTINEYYQLKHLLTTKGMVPLFEKRTIHSIYFDTTDLRMFHESEEGILPRKKIRVRWYNNKNTFTLENKVSSIEGRFKTSKELKEIENPSRIYELNRFDSSYGFIHPALKISYTRQYFTLHKMRITFDKNITYKNLHINRKQTYFDPERVIEVKNLATCSEDFIEQKIPYSTSRFSKYSRGLLISNGVLCSV